MVSRSGRGLPPCITHVLEQQHSSLLSLSRSLSLPLFRSLSLYLSYIRQCSDCSRTHNLKDFPPHTGTETSGTSTPQSRGLPNTNHSKREGECVYLVAVYAYVCVCACVSIHVNSLQKKQHCRYTNQRVYPSLSPPPFPPPPLLLHHHAIYLFWGIH